MQRRPSLSPYAYGPATTGSSGMSRGAAQDAILSAKISRIRVLSMKGQLIFLVFVTFVVLVAGQSVAQIPALHSSAPLSVDAQRALVSQYCAGCHNDNLKSGGF